MFCIVVVCFVSLFCMRLYISTLFTAQYKQIQKIQTYGNTTNTKHTTEMIRTKTNESGKQHCDFLIKQIQSDHLARCLRRFSGQNRLFQGVCFLMFCFCCSCFCIVLFFLLSVSVFFIFLCAAFVLALFKSFVCFVSCLFLVLSVFVV